MRGFEQCSTSYSFGPQPANLIPRRQCSVAQQPPPQRLRVAAADNKDSQLVQSGQGSQALSRLNSQSFLQQKISLLDAHDGSWVDKVDDWAAFFEEDQYLQFEDPALDDTYDGLTTGSAVNTELLLKAEEAIISDLRSTKWREEHPEAVHWQPYPFKKEYEPDIPEPEPLPTNDWHEFELRAFVEKRHRKASTDAAWRQRQSDVGRYSVLNVTHENDVRLRPKWEPIRSWTHEEIWSMITNAGLNADPADVPMKTFDPLGRADYYAEGIKYFPETEEWLAESGHWWEDVAEPDLGQEISMLASDFSDINVDANADDNGEQGGEPDNEEDGANEPDEAAELNTILGPTDL